ncbi:ArgE/DapE family deacylase [Castellaniella sp.]|uniref:ArgE/DapE family deacylase n=1 Tax=Castellaniella sp. TaxID=1955812 RepID=UPI00355DDCED
MSDKNWKAIETRIRDEVDRNFDEQIDYLAEIVRFPSVRGAEHTLQDFLAADMHERGLAVDRWQIRVEDIEGMEGFSPVSVSYDNAFNVVGTHRASTRKGRSLILNGHIDVVPEGPLDMWTHPPYEPHIEDGWMYGRGAGDMKAGVAEMIYALEAVRRLGYRPAADVFVQTVVEEECTGNGALACVQRGYRADAALIPEPMDNTLLSAQVGVIWFQVQLRGHPVHAKDAGTGANAIEAAYPLMQALRELERQWNLPEHKHPAFDGVDHPINLNIGIIRGGDWASSVPAWCNFDVRVSLYPGQNLADIRAQIEDCIAQAARENAFLSKIPPKVIYNGFQAPGYVVPESANEAIECLKQAHLSIYQQELRQVALTGTSDARCLGGPHSHMPVLEYGPTAENTHGFDERVNIESIRKNTQAIALFIANWCQLEDH